MVLAGRAPSSGPLLHPRLCASVVAASSAVHLWLALENQHGAWLGALMVVLAGLCLPCAVHIWQHSRVGALQRVMGCALLMVALHGMLLLGGAHAGHAHLEDYGDPGHAAAQTASLLAVVGMELMTALLAATLVARLRSKQHLTPRA